MNTTHHDPVGAGAGHWAAAMKSYASAWPRADLADYPGFAVFWADSAFTLWNGLLLSACEPTQEQLREDIADAQHFMRGKSQGGLLYACHEFLPGLGLEQAMRDAGLEAKLPLRGMEATLQPQPSWPDDTGLRYARVDSTQAAADFAAVISETYGYPFAVCEAEFVDKPYWREQAWAYVGYEGDEPVATSSIIVSAGALYVGLVATRADFRNKGYGFAINAHTLRQASAATGIRQAVLHATDMGYPVYEKLGFATTMHVTGFGPIGTDQASVAG